MRTWLSVRILARAGPHGPHGTKPLQRNGLLDASVAVAYLAQGVMTLPAVRETRGRPERMERRWNMAGSKKQIRIGAVLMALVVSMIASQAMAAVVARGVARPGGGISLPEWFRTEMTRPGARIGKPLPLEYRQRASELGGKVGWFRLGR